MSSDVAEMPEKLRGKEELQNKEKGKWDGSMGLMGAGAATMADITNQSWHSSLLRLDVDSDYFNPELQPATTNCT